MSEPIYITGQEVVEKNKSSLTLTYRNKKEGLEVTGFDVKVYGDDNNEMKLLLLKLETIAKERLALHLGGLSKGGKND